MSKYIGIVAGGFLALVLLCPLRADDANKAKEIIDKAIKAAGGADNLAKFKAGTWKKKVTLFDMGTEMVHTGVLSIQWPDRCRAEIDGIIAVINRDKGWNQDGGDTQDMSEEELAQAREDLYADWVTTLIPVQDKGFTLALVAETQVNKKRAVGVRVFHKDHKDVTLFFDADSGMLVKSERKTKVEEEGNREVNEESFYADYKEIEGAKIPMMITIKRDGIPFSQEETLEVKPVKKLDDKVFAKP